MRAWPVGAWRRLHLQIFAALLAVVAASFAAVGALASLRHADDAPTLAPIVEAMVATMPPDTDPAFAPAMDRVTSRLGRDVTLRAPDGRLVYAHGPPIPGGEDGWWWEDHRHGLRVTLSDGRVLAFAQTGRPRPLAFGAVLAVTGLIFALGTWPVARSITRRLERLEDTARRWGEGDLRARAEVEGADEVASVARTFNDAADRVQALVDAQRRTLASASHELRSPLTRVRMAVELLDDGAEPRAGWARQAIADIEELDATVGDLLQVGRLQAVGIGTARPVDLRALLAEAAAGRAVLTDGPSATVRGDPRLLRRMLDNLIDNAGRHGRSADGAPIEAWTTPDGVVIADRGPGVPPEEAERIFEPFYRPPGHAESRDGGVGLGLWLVREIAVAHGGGVACRPRDGGGSLFVVTLPVGAEA